MKLVLISIHNIILYCSFSQDDLSKAFLSITFIANRWQRKLIIMDGISQIINSIVLKLFIVLPPITTLNCLLEGMSNFRGNIPIDSFYCKCWVALSNQIQDIEHPDTQKVIAFMKTKTKEYSNDDVRNKLCNSTLSLLTNQKKTQSILSNNSGSFKSSTSNSSQKIALPKSPLKGSSLRTSTTGSSSNESKTEKSTSKKSTTPQSSTSNSAHIKDLKTRLTQLKQRWK